MSLHKDPDVCESCSPASDDQCNTPSELLMLSTVFVSPAVASVEDVFLKFDTGLEDSSFIGVMVTIEDIREVKFDIISTGDVAATDVKRTNTLVLNMLVLPGLFEISESISGELFEFVLNK
jgi:hypothetical protein